MPKSKRNKIGLPSLNHLSNKSFFFCLVIKFSKCLNVMVSAVTLSKTKKKGREHKETIVNAIREAAESYNSIYVFSFENMRNLKFKEFREQLKTTSR